jgi:hypothetical protein
MIWMIVAVMAIVSLSLGIFWFANDKPENLPTLESRYDCTRCDGRDCECDPVPGGKAD